MSVETPEGRLLKKKATYRKYHLKNREKRYALESWSKTVKKLYGKKCAICGSTEKIHSHHIFEKSKFPELSLNPYNGIPLCVQHHYEVHGQRLMN